VPNITTLLAMVVFTPAVAGCLLLLSWLQHPRQLALGVWGSGFLTASVAATLVVVGRGVIPNFWSITVGNALFAVAYGIIWSGARAFEGKSVSRGRREVFGPLDRSTALFDNRASRPKKLNANVGQ
jgi:hypothetical protein